MKFYPALLMLALWSAACFQNAPDPASAVSDALLEEARQSAPFFEIHHETSGAWKVSGRTLFFRLYKNGVAEFDRIDAAKVKDGAQHQAADVAVLKRVKISAADLQKFRRLFESDDFQKDFQILGSNYQGKPCNHGSSIYKIDVASGAQQKSLEISPVCSLNELTNRDLLNSADIPLSLSELIRLASVTQLKHAYRQ